MSYLRVFDPAHCIHWGFRMTLKYPAEWKFEGIGIEIPPKAESAFFDLIGKIAAGNSNPQAIFETFKSAFGYQSYSSSASWAESDLSRAMSNARENAALFVASLWEGMEDIRRSGIPVPSVAHLNRILDEHDVPLVIDPPHLRLKEGDAVFAPAETTDPNAPGFVYRRDAEIGRGGFGTVYRVTRITAVGEFSFAMKVLAPSPFIENKERAFARFRREMQVLAKLQHRGIVQHIEAGVDGDQRPYILMPFIEGAELRDALAGAQPSNVIHTFGEILAALEYAHAQGVVHRDLKPSNILVRSSDRQPIILDFGCAYLFDDASEASLTTTLVGSLSYIPIEVIQDPKHRTAKQDLYACGMMLYQVLAGRLPSPDDYSPIESIRRDCDGVDRLIRDAIAPEKRRIASATEFRQRLAEVLQTA